MIPEFGRPMQFGIISGANLGSRSDVLKEKSGEQGRTTRCQGTAIPIAVRDGPARKLE